MPRFRAFARRPVEAAPLPAGFVDRDAELAEGLRRSDERALDRLLEDRWGLLVAYVMSRMGGDLDQAQDIAQEAFVRVWHHRRDIDPSRSVVAYLYQVARRLTIDELRRRRVRERWATQERTGVNAPTEATALDRLVRTEQLDALARAVARLPTRRREAFTLVHIQHLSYRQAAEAMRTAPQTVANQVAAAMAQLRKELRGRLRGADGAADGIGRVADAS